MSSKNIMTDKVAESILASILEYYECEDTFQEPDRLLSMIKSERLEFADSKDFKLKLFKKINDSDSKELTHINLSLLIGQDLIDADRNGKSDMEIAFSYIANSADLPLGSISKMSTKDIKNCQSVIALFL